MSTNHFMKWYLTMCIFGLSAGVMQYFDLWSQLWVLDQTKISFIILFTFVLESLYIGIRSYRTSKHGASNYLKEIPWFLSDSMVNAGFVGTIIGFMIMLVGPFTDLDVTDVEATKGAISDIALGMGVALSTTLTGLICSMFMKFQLVQFSEEDEV